MKSASPLLLVVVVLGCKGTTTPSEDAATRSAVVLEQKSTTYAPPPPAASSSNQVSNLNLAPAVPTKPVPAILRTEGYEWYGLDNQAVIKMRQAVSGVVKTGAVETRLAKVAADGADFVQTWTGDLSTLPTIGIEARQDGIYVTSLFGSKLSEPYLDLPADPKPGDKWSYKADAIPPQGGDLDISGTDRIVRRTKLKIGDKEYDALEIEDDGTMSYNQKTVTDISHKWLVKGKGFVKIESDANGSAGAHHLDLSIAG